MLAYFLRRFFYMLLLLFLLSIVSFTIIQLPPGDFMTYYLQALAMRGSTPSESELENLTRQYGLDRPAYQQYFRWSRRALQGDFGRSFDWRKPVSELLEERLLLTVIMNITAMVLIYIIAIPVGIYSATHQYSFGDYSFTVIGFIGLATPGFLLALVLMVVFYNLFGLSVSGLFSAEYVNAPWSLGRLFDLFKHLPVPVIIIAAAGTASLIRVMRNCLLDEFRKQYVITARAKGVSERRLLFRYPVRVAINPIISTIGWMLPATISGGTITAMVLSLPTIGPILFRALRNQDMYLAGTIVMLLGFLTVVGTFISDLVLAWVDPRIHYEKKS